MPKYSPSNGGESAKEDDDGMLCVEGTVGDTTSLSTGLPVYSRPHKVGTVQKFNLGCFYVHNVRHGCDRCMG